MPKMIFKERRSIRRFEDLPIATDKLTEILEAARWAPSWGNSQCCELILVEKKEVKKKLVAALSPKNPASLAVENAPVVVAVCGELKKAGYYNDKPMTKFGDWFMYDLGLVTQNICLAAHAHGVGSVIVGAFDHDKVKELLQVPDGYEVVSLLPMGYPAHSPSPPKRKPIDKLVHYDSF